MNKCGKVITISQSKGGSCKTTTAINLCGAIIELGYKAILLDMEESKPDAYNWRKQGEENKNSTYFVEPFFHKVPSSEIKKYKDNYDYIIIDTPPNYIQAAFKAVAMADYVILPCTPSFLDQNNLAEAIEIPMLNNKPYAILISKFQTRQRVSNQMKEEIDATGYGLKTIITSKSKMVEATYYGEWIGSYAPKSDSHLEFMTLAKEVVANIKQL